MRIVDRLLLLTAAVSGVLVTRGPAMADPDAWVCVNHCQQTQQYYDCVKKHAYEYFLDDCLHCAANGAGSCVIRSKMPEGTCVKREVPRVLRYVKNYKMMCGCEGLVTRVEIQNGEKSTEWDSHEGDVYYTCEPKK